MSMRVHECRQAILRILEEAAPYALPEEQLLIGLNARVRPPLGISDLVVHLGWLWEQRMIQKLDGKYGDKIARWLVTEAGQAELRR